MILITHLIKTLLLRLNKILATILKIYTYNIIYQYRQYSKFSLLVVEDIGVEPMTSCVQGRRSSQLS
jgi:hypothetical protein